MYGLGGEILGRAVPALARRGLRSATDRFGDGAEAAARGAMGVGEEGENLLVHSERRAQRSAIDTAADMPPGPERDSFLINSEKELVDAAATRVSGALDAIRKDFGDLGDVSLKPKRIEPLVSKTAPIHREWAEATRTSLLDMRDRIRGTDASGRPTGQAPAASAPMGSDGLPVSLEGIELRDMMKGAERGMKDESLEFLRNDERFGRTGKGFNPRVNDETLASGKGLGMGDGIILRRNGEGKFKLQDGRHRITVARERGMTEVFGRVLGEGDKVVFEGMIPVAPRVGKASGGAVSTEGLGAMSAKIQKALERSSKELGEAKTSAEYFLAADKAKRQLQRFRSALSRGARNAQDSTSHEALGALLQESSHRLRMDLERKDLWGKAGDMQVAVNAAWADKYLRGAGTAEGDLGRHVGKADYETGDMPHRYDPAKLRTFLKSDAVGRGLTPENLDNVLAGAEDMLAAHKRFGTADPKQLERLRSNIDTVRKDLALADEVHAARKRTGEATAASKAETAASRAESSRSELGQDLALGAAGMVAGALGGGWAGAAVVGAGKLLRYWRLTNTIAAASDAASKSAAKGAVRGMVKQAGAVAERVLAGAPKVAVPAFSTALSRFQGEYPDAQSSFEAKRQAIEKAQGDPILLATALGASLGDLASVDPKLYADLAVRMTAATDYMFRNLPPQVSVSLTHPRGIPLSRQALRDTALVWNSVFYPETVLEDVGTGMVSPKQIKAFREVHPDRYQQLVADLTTEIANNFSDIPTQRKLKFDLIMGMDGAAGKAYSSVMGRAAQRYRERQAEKPGRKATVSGGSNGATPARALSNIGRGVTSSA
jgi:hypothetical protein